MYAHHTDKMTSSIMVSNNNYYNYYSLLTLIVLFLLYKCPYLLLTE